MEKKQVSSVQFIIIGILSGMAIVLGAYMLIKSQIQPEPIKNPALIQHQRDNTKKDKEYCPVCKKEVNTSSDFFEELYGKKYHFCSDICLRSFRDQPLLYLKDMKLDVNIEILKEGDPPPAPTNENTEVPETGKENPSDTEEGGIEQYQDTPLPESPAPQNSSEDIPMPDEITQPPPPPPKKIDTNKPKKAAKPQKEYSRPKVQQNSPRNQSTTKSSGGSEPIIEEIPLEDIKGRVPPSPPKQNIPKPKQTTAPPQDELEIEEIPLN